MIKRKILSVLLCSALLIGCLGACGQSGESPAVDSSSVSLKEDSSSDKDASITIVSTIFPQYDWVREIIKDSPAEIETTLLLKDGVDLHSYEPTAEDIMKIAMCDVFIYVGGESDKWVEDALSEATNKNMVAINLLDELGDSAKEEVIVPGMEEEEGEEESEYDEHVWLSLKNASILSQVIEEAIAQKDPANADLYAANLTSYKEKIDALDKEFADVAKNGAVKTLLFGDRFPFLYFAEDYGLDYYAAFAGCSAETEASFETIIFLAEKTNELGLKSICTIENSDQKIAATIRDNTETKDQEILVFDSLQSIRSSDIENGVSYLSLMENNLDVLKKALG